MVRVFFFNFVFPCLSHSFLLLFFILIYALYAGIPHKFFKSKYPVALGSIVAFTEQTALVTYTKN